MKNAIDDELIAELCEKYDLKKDWLIYIIDNVPIEKPDQVSSKDKSKIKDWLDISARKQLELREK